MGRVIVQCIIIFIFILEERVAFTTKRSKILIFKVMLTCRIMQNKGNDHKKVKPVHSVLSAFTVFTIFYIQFLYPTGSLGLDYKWYDSYTV